MGFLKTAKQLVHAYLARRSGKAAGAASGATGGKGYDPYRGPGGQFASGPHKARPKSAQARSRKPAVASVPASRAAENTRKHAEYVRSAKEDMSRAKSGHKNASAAHRAAVAAHSAAKAEHAAARNPRAKAAAAAKLANAARDVKLKREWRGAAKTDVARAKAVHEHATKLHKASRSAGRIRK